MKRNVPELTPSEPDPLRAKHLRKKNIIIITDVSDEEVRQILEHLTDKPPHLKQ